MQHLATLCTRWCVSSRSNFGTTAMLYVELITYSCRIWCHTVTQVEWISSLHACRLKEKLKSHDWQDDSNIDSCGMCFHFEDTDSLVSLVHEIKAGHSQLPATKNTKRERIPYCCMQQIGMAMAAELATLPQRIILTTYSERCSHNYKFAVKQNTNTHLRCSSFVQCLSPCAIASHPCGPMWLLSRLWRETWNKTHS